jgi:hypothetical protein
MAARLSILVRTTTTTTLRRPWQTLFHPKFIRSSAVYTSIKVGSLRFKSTQKLTSEKNDSLHQQSVRNKIWNENFERIKEHVQNIATKDAKPLNSSLKYWPSWQRISKRNKDLGLPSTLTDDQEEKLESLGLFSGDLIDLKWNKRYEELLEYYKEHGHSMFPVESQTHKELGIWVGTQRRRYKQKIEGKPEGSIMTDERIRLLNELDFVWDPLEELWTKRYEELVEYYRRHGHTMVPRESETHKELGFWVGTQRRRYKQKIEGKPGGSLMTDKRIRMLNELNFVWDPHDDLWTKRYEELAKYYKEHGHSMVPTESQTHKELGIWVSTQRQFFKLSLQGKLPKKSVFSNERIYLLNELDFVWYPLENDWSKRYEELVEYYKEHGHSMVPMDSRTYNALSRWVTLQRELYKQKRQGTLSKGSGFSNERICLLNEVDFVWDPLENYWTKRYEELVEYYKEHGHSMVPNRSQTHQELGTWVTRQRGIYKKNILNQPGGAVMTDARIRLLNELEFVWDPLEFRWRAQYQKLVEYAKQHGRGAFINDRRIYNWLCQQRMKYVKWKDGQKSTMTQERADLLEKLGYTFDESDAD